MKTLVKRTLTILFCFALCQLFAQFAYAAEAEFDFSVGEIASFLSSDEIEVSMSVGETRPFSANPGGFVGTISKNSWSTDDPSILRLKVGKTETCSCTVTALKPGITRLYAKITYSGGTYPLRWLVTVTDGPVPSPEPSTYPTYFIEYDANGGTGAPESQIKKYNLDIKIPNIRPTRADKVTGHYTVTLDPRGGSVTPDSLDAPITTKYSFSGWGILRNPLPDEKIYQPGDTYDINADRTFFARWDSSSRASAVELPTPKLAGYHFEGWAENSSAAIGTIGEYTPTRDVTLHAVWIQDFNEIPITAATFPDSNFRAHVQLFDKDRNGSLSYSEMASVTQITCSGKGIKSLAGIQYFTELKELDCSNNELVSLNLSALPPLTTLNCSNNNLEELTADSDVTPSTVNAAYNSLRIIYLPDCPRLRNLTITYDSSLEVLNLHGNANLRLTSGYVSIISSSLRYLDMEGNRYLKDISVRGDSLEHLNLHGCTALTSFSGHDIGTAVDLSGCSALTSVKLTTTQPVDLDLSSCTGLNGRLEFSSSTKLNSLDLSYCSELTYLDVSNNELTRLNVRETGLQNLTCMNNHLRSLDISGANLIWLLVRENDLDTLDISSCPRLSNYSNFKEQHLFYSSRSRGGSNISYSNYGQISQYDPMLTVDTGTRIVSGQQFQLTKEPSDNTVYEGSTARFSMAASRSSSYQWYVQKAGQSAIPCDFSGSDTDTLLVPAALELDGAAFYCIVLDSRGQTLETRHAALTVLPKITPSEPTPTAFSVSYDPNGGSGAPASQIKTRGQALTLSSAKPTHASSMAGSYTVTLDPNGGSVSQRSLSAARKTSYTFKSWNTKSDGTGTSYKPGASYTEDANLTLYAQWTGSTGTAPVTLPTPTRAGYTFRGWATSSTASSGVTGSYTPTGNVTLYAVWGNIKTFILPKALTVIEAEAFAGGAFTDVYVPDRVTAIGARAFADCPNLRDIFIPESASSIAATAFSNIYGLTIHGVDGSYAEFYASKYGFGFVPDYQ